ncbi:amino acid adenylation domain-containing protein [Kitasatospora sp. MAP5-34]|uniref:amino acid adenylation domain-containing protein n=1 Tax=Kitasatospora sp. MAP5-34 TaxID=3035102 RepID=UPI002473E4D6|nr:amino acid adenylation domain-containing protein [Kitasatospora sp. MAP5-34]MDH6578571.1 amino acid adenylation domain-containing protein [Kitasatospora sp. MAP5-34]
MSDHDEPTTTELPADLPPPATGGFRPGTEERRLPAETAGKLAELTAAGGATTEPVVLLAALAAVLHRHTGNTDLLIGLDARLLGDQQAAPVLLPLRLPVDPAASFAELLAETRHAATEALAHAPEPPGPGTGIRIAVRPPGTDDQPAPLDAAFTLTRQDGAATLGLRYDQGRHTRATAVWLLGHLATLLAGAVAEPGRRLRDLRVQHDPAPAPDWDLPTPAQYVPPAPPGAAESLVDRFRTVSHAHGDRIAVSGPSGRYRYAELDRLTTRLAHRLRRHAGPGTRVALLCEHDIGAAVGIWSVLKSGAAYVPLDPRQPDGRLARIAANAGVSAIVCDPALADRARKLVRERPVLTLEPAGPEPEGELPGPAGPQELAYLLHTSGSTGTPKAVMQSHGNVLAHTLGYAQRIRIGVGDQLPLLARLAFDAAAMDFFGALLTGATLHITDPLLPAPQLRGRLGAMAASVLHCTPTLFRHLVGDLGEDRSGPDAVLAGVRVVVLGGEEATRQDLRRFLAVFGRRSVLVNGLGPTECTVALQHLATRADLDRPTLPVGRPVPGLEVRLLDAEGEPTEVYGELELIGDRVALGYWDQKETTAAAFRTHPDGSRSYRTGDLARRLPDGSLVFLGRRDRQLKIRGHRLEPGEIESALRAHPTVAQAAVAVDDRSAPPRLVAYVSSATAFPPDGRELVGYLARILPDYAVPAQVVVLDSMPLGPTGKLDRSRLPLPDPLPAPTAGADDEQPQTPVERAVARSWCRTLALPRAGLHDSFMASGGDSIRMLALLAALRDEFAVDVPLTEFLNAPTIATLARIIDRESIDAELAV